MKVLFLGGALLLWSLLAGAQVPFTLPDSASFFTLLDSADRYFPPDTLEGGDYNRFQRARMTWGPRLAPTGKMSRATAAMTRYTRAFHGLSGGGIHGLPVPVTLPDPHPSVGPWGELGNTAPLVGNNSPKAKGMGQIHRLAFHPQWNGTTNQILYAGSHYGGLFRSDDGGQNWYNYHTDRGLSMTSIGGVAASDNHVFVVTGNGDYGYSAYGRRAQYEPNRGLLTNLSPLHTQGVYRNRHTSPTARWSPINGQSVTMIDGTVVSDLLAVFAGGGTMREIVVHPSNSSLLLIATSQGIFRTTNGGTTWTQVLVGPANGSGGYELDTEWRGLVFHPTNPNIVYASGQDVYHSLDGGATWLSMTAGQRLDTNAVRTNLAVTVAAPNRIYAYTKGGGNGRIHYYDGTQWVFGGSIPDGYAGWLGIAVHPLHPNIVHVAEVNVQGSWEVGIVTQNTLYEVDHNGRSIHDDVHYLGYPPNGDTVLYAGTHGGVSKKTILPYYSYNHRTWTNLYNGLGVSTVWAFDDWEGNGRFIIVANQDIGVNQTYDLGQVWYSDHGIGDGYGVRVNDQDGVAYIKGNVYQGAYTTHPAPTLRALKNYNDIGESNFDVPRRFHGIGAGNPEADVPNVFAGLNHPKDESFYLGFTELYQRGQSSLAAHEIPYGTFMDTIRYFGYIYTTSGTRVGSPQPQCYDNGGTVVRLDTVPYTLLPSWSYRVDSMCLQPVTRPDYNAIYHRLWTHGSDLRRTQPYTARRRIIELAFSEDEATDYTYLATVGDVSNHRCDLFFNDRAQGCDTCFLPLTANLPIDASIPDSINMDPNPITGIAVDPLDGNRVWVSFSGYAQDIKVWYSEDAGDTWATYDDSLGSLAALNLPINGIVYQRGTNDRLYIATDAGVYVREAGGAWLRYGENIPNVRVTELKINYCVGKLRAATFGRGVWENDLLPVEDGITKRSFRTISSSEVWEADKHLSRDLRILSGASLHLNNMTLHMPKNGLIVVEPGAELLVNGSTLTNSCGQGWQGIEVWGQTSGQQDGSEGVLVLTNSTIEHAKEAVSPWQVGNFPRPDGSGGTGGTVIATNTHFVNNWRSVGFMRYQSGGQERSAFTRCTFTVNDEHRQGFLGHLSAWDIAGLTIKGCTFEDQRTNKVGDAYGIYTLRASVHLTAAPTTPQQLARNNRFEGLSRGIEIGSDPTRFNWVIDQSDFHHNWKGAVVRADAGVRVLRSEFKMAPYGNQPYAYGLGLLRQGAFVVEQNEFTGDDQAPSSFPSLGIWVDDTKSGYNRLRRNYFEELPIGVLVNGDNGDDQINPRSGMQLWCNEHVENAYDVSLFNDPTDPSGASIAEEQGSVNQPAKNIFSYPLQPFQGQDWHFYNDASGMATVNYWIPPNAAQQEVPTDIVNVTRMTSNLPGSLNFCADYYTNLVIPRPQVGGEPMSLADLKQEYYTALAECQSEESKVPCDSAAVAMKAQAVSYWAGEVVYYYQNDTLGPNWDSTLVWLQKIPGLLARYDIVEHYWAQGRYTEALDEMNAISSTYPLSGAALDNHTDYANLLDLLYGAYQDNRNEALLSREEVDLLRIIADNDYGFAAQYAANIINFFYAREYIYHPALPQGQEETFRELPLSEGKLTVFPNPSHTWADVQYELPENEIKGTLLITAVNGRVIQEINLGQVNGQVELNTKDWIPGIYFIALVTDDTLQHQTTLIVRR